MLKPALSLMFKRYLPGVGVMLVISGCGMADYTTARTRYDIGSRGSETVVQLSFDYDKAKDPYKMQVNRVDDGYALQAPISEENNISTHMTLSHTHDHDWFIGPKLSFAF
jgi:hypothetical protein